MRCRSLRGNECELRRSRIDGLAPSRYPWPAYPQANPHSPLPLGHFNERHRHNQSDHTDHQNTHRGTPSSNSEWRRPNGPKRMLDSIASCGRRVYRRIVLTGLGTELYGVGATGFRLICYYARFAPPDVLGERFSGNKVFYDSLL
jgi:hypothetical protein